MDSETSLDYALFQLSPKRSRCDLFVSGNGKTEKIASGFLKPFVTHLKVAEEQAAQAAQSIKLQVEKRRNGGTWFNKGTLERFVRFVSTPEVLELVSTFDAEMSQLEGARRIYSQGAGDPLTATPGENQTTAAAAADITKKELLRAIDVRLVALKQDLTTACTRASSAGFTLDNVSELSQFADHFGADRLNEACAKFISLCQRRPELVSHQQLARPPASHWKDFEDRNLRSSSGSDMSIDETEEPTGPGKPLHGSGDRPQFHKSGNSQQPDESPAEPMASKQPKPVPCFVEKQVEKETDKPIPPTTVAAEPAQLVGGSSRRLSVQDRINLFESKQKEQVSSPSTVNNNSGGGVSKNLPGKGEHRRTPSDISMEKSVLRRWSGASDMSIDLNSSYNSSFSDRKESGSAAGTPTSANLHQQSSNKTEEEVAGLKETASSRSLLGQKDTLIGTSSSSVLPSSVAAGFPPSKAQTRAFAKSRIHKEDENAMTLTTNLGSAMEKDHMGNLLKVSNERDEHHGLTEQTAPDARMKNFQQSTKGTSFLDKLKPELVGMKIQEDMPVAPCSFSTVEKKRTHKAQEGYQSQPGEISLAEDGLGSKDQQILVSQFRTFGRTQDIEGKLKYLSDSQTHLNASPGKGEDISLENDLTAVVTQKTPPKMSEEVVGKDPADSHFPSRSFPVKTKDPVSQGANLQTKLSAPGHIKKLQGVKNEGISSEGNGVPVFPARKVKECPKTIDPPLQSSVDQVQVMRPPKGNQELNDELQMKANELEKLFAAHKLRVHNDQMSSSRRSRHADVQVDHVPKAVEIKPAVALPNPFPDRNLVKDGSSSGPEFDTNLLLKMEDNQDHGNNIQQQLGTLSSSDESRGKFYEKYMQKRNAKLREDWASKGAHKEAILKAMHDSLERSHAEMRTKLSGSGDGRDSHARRRAEKMRSFSVGSAIREKDQAVEALQEEDLLEQGQCDQEKTHSDDLSGDGSSRSTSSKKHSSSKTLSSSTPRTSVASIPKPSVKPTSSAKRRNLPENPLAQSVPNFSDFRKENTKPSTEVSRINARGHSRNFSRSKSITEETNDSLKGDNQRRSHSMRKGCTGPVELKDLSPLNDDSANLAPLRFSKDQTGTNFSDRIHKSGGSKPFLRKGNNAGPATDSIAAKQKASINYDVSENGYDSEEMVDQLEDSLETVKDEEESEKTSTEGNPRETDFLAVTDNERPRLSHQFRHSDDPGSEAAATAASKYNNFGGNMQESPGESPRSWNLHAPHTFSYAQEASDIDASVDSPIGSPASWNSHPLNQMMEADAARMRKKWGSAQIPVLVANASQQSRKDMTKGFKRLLKFGRKSRGVESLVNDWVSASTASEGDDDMEDSFDLAARSSDDLRKSRMGYPIPSYDGFNECDIFSDQAQSLRSSIPNPPANFKLREDLLTGSSLKAPRSFFSLSSFRSKGNESKLR
ncbi:uncharacterized protein [Typha latifolia]|uniref:uncharacterized protein n=1 Tax=Typha latifolia TaxID=4733 RepID=UPI003C2C48CE